MTKKHFIALADSIRDFNRKSTKPASYNYTPFNQGQIEMLAAFCAEQNPQFNRARWLAYIAGECGPNGGRK